MKWYLFYMAFAAAIAITIGVVLDASVRGIVITTLVSMGVGALFALTEKP